MGWQKRSTEKIHDSMTRHGFMIGCRTGNIIGFKVKSKSCSTYAQENSFNVRAKECNCVLNWEGVSGGMEAGVALEMCVELHNNSKYSLFVEFIVSDDDSTIWAHL